MTPIAPAALLASPSRVEILHVLQSEGPTTIDVLSHATGLHRNTVREHLARLESARYVRSEPEVRSTRGRPRIVYRVTSASEARRDPEAQAATQRAVAHALLSRALLEAMGDGAAPAAASAARQVGARSPVADGVAAPSSSGADVALLALEAHLDAMGFDPQPEVGVHDGAPGTVDALGADGMPQERARTERTAGDGAVTFHLWRCPFVELARDRTQVVCAVHAGLAQGVLDQVGGGYAVERLTPFVGPHHCALVVRKARDGGGL